ncbi:MAG: aa3-type cytochrome c oxidase subunit IV [Caulobacteraceae bacterium]
MATHGGDYTRGDMIIEEHEKTYSGFLKMTKWGSLYLAALLLLLTLWFCTPAGFMGGIITAVVILVLGTLVLSEKHKV